MIFASLPNDLTSSLETHSESFLRNNRPRSCRQGYKRGTTGQAYCHEKVEVKEIGIFLAGITRSLLAGQSVDAIHVHLPCCFIIPLATCSSLIRILRSMPGESIGWKGRQGQGVRGQERQLSAYRSQLLNVLNCAYRSQLDRQFDGDRFSSSHNNATRSSSSRSSCSYPTSPNTYPYSMDPRTCPGCTRSSS